jgi:hypothetical protein
MSRFRLRTCHLLVGGLALLGWAGAFSEVAFAAGSKLPKIKSLQLGFEGQYKEDYWTPAVVTIQGGSEPAIAAVLIEVPDGDGVGTIVSPNRPVQLLADRETSVMMYVKPGNQSPNITVRLLIDGEEPIKDEFQAGTQELPHMALAATRPLIVTLGPPVGIGDRSDAQIPEDLRPKVAHLASIEELPTRWYGYEGVQALVLITSQPDVYRQLSAGSARLAALEDWIQRGGRVIFCVGQSAEEVLAAGSPLAALAPGKLDGRVPLRQTTAFETLADTGERLDLGMKDGQPGRLDVPRLVDVAGKIEAYEGVRRADLPLVVRTPRGFGEIVFVAADLDRPPLSTWAGRQQLWDKLLGRDKQPIAQEDEAEQGRVTRSGYSDLAGQLHTGLEQFAGVSVPFSLVVFLIVVYIACIGPLDYFVLKKFFKRMELTWVTFPGIVVAFSLGAYVLAHELKGEQLRNNQVDVVDVDTSSGLVRGTMWSTIFSPQTDLYDLSLETKLAGSEQPAKSDVLLSWLGMPGADYGGMRQASAASSLFNGAYSFSPELDRVNRMPISVWSTKAMTARWTTTAAPQLSSKLRDKGDKLLAGSIKNGSPLKLTDAVLVYDRWAYPLGTLEPQGVVNLETGADPQTVDTYFKHMTIVGGRDATAAYDVNDSAVERIMEIMLFHEAAGGVRYTRLSNAYQGYLDAGHQLRAGRAVLMGRAAEPATQLLRDGKPLAGPQDQRWTFYRFMLPVDPAGGG